MGRCGAVVSSSCACCSQDQGSPREDKRESKAATFAQLGLSDVLCGAVARRSDQCVGEDVHKTCTHEWVDYVFEKRLCSERRIGGVAEVSVTVRHSQTSLVDSEDVLRRGV